MWLLASEMSRGTGFEDGGSLATMTRLAGQFQKNGTQRAHDAMAMDSAHGNRHCIRALEESASSPASTEGSPSNAMAKTRPGMLSRHVL